MKSEIGPLRSIERENLRKIQYNFEKGSLNISPLIDYLERKIDFAKKQRTALKAQLSKVSSLAKKSEKKS